MAGAHQVGLDGIVDSSRHLELVWLDHLDVERLALTDVEILTAVERSLKAQGLGQAVIEPRVHLEPDPNVQGHFNVLRGSLSPAGLAGVKIVSNYSGNLERGLPTGLALLTLFDPETGMPVAIIDATAITEMRTGAITALGVRHLARAGAPILGHIGARGSAYWNVRLIASVCELDEIRVHARRPESRNAFALRMSEELGREVVACDSWENCLRGTDIMVEASRLEKPEPHFRTSWVEPGALVIPYGSMSAVELSLVDVMDKVVVDDWGQCRDGKFGALREHVDTGRLGEHNLYAELADIVAGRRIGRENSEERILFWHRGLSLSDIALGGALLAKAKGLDVGRRLRIR